MTMDYAAELDDNAQVLRVIVGTAQWATDNLGGVPEERICQRRHTPMQPDALLTGDAGQHRHGSISKARVQI